MFLFTHIHFIPQADKSEDEEGKWEIILLQRKKRGELIFPFGNVKDIILIESLPFQLKAGSCDQSVTWVL